MEALQIVRDDIYGALVPHFETPSNVFGSAVQGKFVKAELLEVNNYLV